MNINSTSSIGPAVDRARETPPRERDSADRRVRVERLERRALLSAVPVGEEFRANVFTPGFQADAAVAVDADGDFVVTWYSMEQDGDGRGIYARLYDPAGVPKGDEFRVNTFTTGYQSNPDVAMDDDGDFVIVWQSENQDGPGWGIYGQRFNAVGAPQGDEFKINTSTTTTNQRLPRVAMDADGDFIVVWEQYSPATTIIGRRFDAAGVPLGNPFMVPSTTTFRITPAVAMSADGAFAVAWANGQLRDIEVRVFNAAGTAITGDVLVNTFTTNNQFYPAVAMSDSGDFVVAWESDQQDGSSLGVYGQRFDETGAKQGDEFRANTFTTDHQHNAAVAMDADGNFVVTWTSGDQNGTGYGIFAQRYNAAGAPQAGEFLVNSYTTNVQHYPAIAIDADGDFVIAWESFGQDGSGFGVYAQQFAPALVVSASEFQFETAPHQLRFTFNTDVSASLGLGDLVVENLSTGQTIPVDDFSLNYDTATDTATFTYTGVGGDPDGTLPDGNYRATLQAAGITAPNGVPLPEDHVFDFFFLRGDANHDGRVNLRDFNILATNFGQSGPGIEFSDADFNYDQTVNLRDFNILAARFGQVLGPATSSSSSSFTSDRDRQATDDESDDLLA